MTKSNGSVIEDESMQVPTQIVSDALLKVFALYVGNMILTVAVFGCITNTANVVVYYKLGFSRPSNICFFSLAIADFVSIVWIFMTVLSNRAGFQTGEVFIRLGDLALVVAPAFYLCSSYGSWVTAVISMERSCCVVFPMKVKQIFTKRVVALLLLAMLVYETGTIIPYFWAFRLKRTVGRLTNNTILVLDRANANVELAVLVSVVSFTIPTLICFSLVIIGTTFLIITFKRSRSFRAKMTGNEEKKSSPKDEKLVLSVIMICVLYIFGFALNITKFLVSMIEPSFQFMDPRLGNLNSMVTALALLFQTISSSANIFVYIKMNSRFRETFEGCFQGAKKKSF